MYRKGWLFLLLFVFLAIMFSLPEQVVNGQQEEVERLNPRWRQQLAKKLDKIIDDPMLAGASVGISIRFAETGEVLYEHEGDRRLVPASNQKLLVASAVLHHLGADYRFVTSLWTEGERNGGVLQGNPYLKGQGDPTLTPDRLRLLAQQVKDAGIERIAGDLILDDSWFDEVRLGEDWAWDNESSYVGAPVSALTFSPNEDYDAATVLLQITPGQELGEAVQVYMMPLVSSIQIENRATTVAQGAKWSLSAEREHGTPKIIIKGTVPKQTSPVRRWVSVWDPTVATGEVFLHYLSEVGVVVEGEMQKGRKPEHAVILLSQESIPLRELLIPFMKLSNNSHAEILTKSLGRVVKNEGSWKAGLQVIREYLHSKGVQTETLLLRDGSGMSHLNLLPPEEVTALLYHVQEEPYFELFYNSLPQAGHPERLIGGTMRNRLRGTLAEGNARAKTGSLTAVDTLAGYVNTKDGQPLIFAIFINNFIGAHPTAIEDEIVRVLAETQFPHGKPVEEEKNEGVDGSIEMESYQ
ncbi:D-alanyl-D-alanine carboxypeptidase/D-alanyl-D-alanine endopeptidase [Rubeoparvulum massiliense]|uniref:D-alanyl-D-alanine carboxypeptidase/D-alanyl-D-alanine endopeptidase n=1 Tax=Rubeoparvulum massiliense TaxID=1631346 RepID=UPI00065E67ED|nr:D-alanyl-D-alanine carboxypeptidase/D-alanyl-D-alanine-endopeptidase [Rubeoparvulum massiliense]